MLIGVAPVQGLAAASAQHRTGNHRIKVRETSLAPSLFAVRSLAFLGQAPQSPATQSYNGHTSSSIGTLTASTSSSSGNPIRQ